jgi:LysM repeat protein
VAIRIRWTIGLLLVVTLLTACTRRTDEPVVELESIAPAATSESVPAGEPEVQAEPTLLPAIEAPAEASPTDEPVEDDSDLPPRPEQTFQYTVQEGDNLSFLAEKFGTTMQTLRELNFLTDDNIQSGAILVVPYVEGITAEGLPTPLPGPYEYTVQPGDTLGDLAFRFDVSTLAIIEANNLLTPDSLLVGSTLIIPGYTPDAPQASGGTAGGAATGNTDDFVRYTVQPSDTFFSIAQEFGIDPDDLAQANNISDRNVIQVGQELVIPGVTQRDQLIRQGQTHTVAAGETLSQIAARYGVSMETIMDLNGLDNADAIVVGQQLVIPGE